MAVRVCDACGVIDDQPRHQYNVAPGELPDPEKRVYRAVIAAKASDDDKIAALGQLDDQTLQIRHIACCAAAGCPTQSCQTQ